MEKSNRNLLITSNNTKKTDVAFKMSSDCNLALNLAIKFRGTWAFKLKTSWREPSKHFKFWKQLRKSCIRSNTFGGLNVRFNKFCKWFPNGKQDDLKRLSSLWRQEKNENKESSNQDHYCHFQLLDTNPIDPSIIEKPQRSGNKESRLCLDKTARIWDKNDCLAK